MRTLGICVLMLAVTVGCGKRATVNQTYSEGESPLGDPEQTYGTDVSLSSPGESDLARAEALAREQDFAGATRILERLCQHGDRAVREEALYELGQLQGHLLNPDKDYTKAIATLNVLLADYPQSRFRLRARQVIERFESFEDSESGG